MNKTLIRLTSSADDVVIDSPIIDREEARQKIANMAEASAKVMEVYEHTPDRLVLVTPTATLTFEAVAPGILNEEIANEIGQIFRVNA